MKKTKRFVAIFTMICFLLSSSAVYAANTTTDQNGNQNRVTNEEKVQIQEREQVSVEEREQAKEQKQENWMQQIKEQYRLIHQNNLTIIEKRNEIAQTRAQIMKQLNNLKQEKASLNDKTIEDLKAYLEKIRQQKKYLKERVGMGNIHKQLINLRAAKRDGTLDIQNSTLKDIITEQEEVIGELEDTLVDFEDLLEHLTYNANHNDKNNNDKNNNDNDENEE